MNNRLTMFFLWLGSFLLILGLGRSYIDLRVTVLSLCSIIFGAILFVLVFIKIKQKMGAVVWSSSLKKGSIVVLYSIVLIAALGYLNFLSIRYDIRWDLTKARQHTLKTNTLKLIKNIKSKVTLTVFYVGLPPKYLEDLLKEYERNSKGQISGRIIDPIVDIGSAAQFGNVINSKESKLIVQSQKERSNVDFTEKPLTEESVNDALIKVTRRARHAYFLSGHGEYSINEDGPQGLSKFVNLLDANNVEAKSLLLGLNGKVPDDCDFLVVAGAQRQLSGYEEETIKTYLENGGDSLILVENVLVTTPDKPLTTEEMKRNPSLNGILNDWGVKVADDVVVDLVSHATGDVGSPATRNYFARKTLTKDLDYTFYVRPRSISLLSQRRPTINLMPIVMTNSSDQSWGETDRNLLVKFDKGSDRSGPVPIAFVIAEPRKKEGQTSTRIALFTDADFLSNAYIDYYSNTQMGLNAVGWLTDMDDDPANVSRDVKIKRLDLTSQQRRSVAVILMVMPVLIALTGLAAWLKNYE